MCGGTGRREGRTSAESKRAQMLRAPPGWKWVFVSRSVPTRSEHRDSATRLALDGPSGHEFAHVLQRVVDASGINPSLWPKCEFRDEAQASDGDVQWLWPSPGVLVLARVCGPPLAVTARVRIPLTEAPDCCSVAADRAPPSSTGGRRERADRAQRRGEAEVTLEVRVSPSPTSEAGPYAASVLAMDPQAAVARVESVLCECIAQAALHAQSVVGEMCPHEACLASWVTCDPRAVAVGPEKLVWAADARDEGWRRSRRVEAAKKASNRVGSAGSALCMTSSSFSPPSAACAAAAARAPALDRPGTALFAGTSSELGSLPKWRLLSSAVAFCAPRVLFALGFDCALCWGGSAGSHASVRVRIREAPGSERVFSAASTDITTAEMVARKDAEKRKKRKPSPRHGLRAHMGRAVVAARAPRRRGSFVFSPTPSSAASSASPPTRSASPSPSATTTSLQADAAFDAASLIRLRHTERVLEEAVQASSSSQTEEPPAGRAARARVLLLFARKCLSQAASLAEGAASVIAPRAHVAQPTTGGATADGTPVTGARV